MTDYNKIEELYKKHCEISAENPPQDMWSRIEASLDEKRSEKRIVWMRYVAVAASLAVLVSLTTWIWLSIVSQDKNTFLSDNIISSDEQNIVSDDFSNKSEINENESINNNETNSFTPENSTQKNNYISYLQDKNFNASNDFIKSKPVDLINHQKIRLNIASSNFIDKITIKKIKEEQPEAPIQDTYNLDIFFASLYPEPIRAQKQQAKVELGGAYSPVYSYRQSSVESNPYFPNKDIPTEDGIIYGGGGLNLNVKFNNRWSVESGVKYAKLGHKINDPDINKASFKENGNTMVVNQVFLGNSMGVVNIDKAFSSKIVDPQIAPPPPGGINLTDTYQSIEQNLDYLEVPFSLRYYLIDNKFSVSMSAGLSANFLINNNFYLKTNNTKEKIGETDGISNLSMSTHAGLSIAVPVFKRLSLQVEPRINYFIQEINKDYTFKYRPYSFGIYSGVKYQFGK